MSGNKFTMQGRSWSIIYSFTESKARKLFEESKLSIDEFYRLRDWCFSDFKDRFKDETSLYLIAPFHPVIDKLVEQFNFLFTNIKVTIEDFQMWYSVEEMDTSGWESESKILFTPDEQKNSNCYKIKYALVKISTKKGKYNSVPRRHLLYLLGVFIRTFSVIESYLKYDTVITEETEKDLLSWIIEYSNRKSKTGKREWIVHSLTDKSNITLDGLGLLDDPRFVNDTLSAEKFTSSQRIQREIWTQLQKEIKEKNNAE